MLDLRGHNMPSRKLSRQDTAQNGEVIRFCTAARKDDLLRPGADESCHMFPRFFNRIAGLQTFAMETRWIAKDVGEKGPHSFPNSGVQRRSRVVIEIDERLTHALFRNAQVLALMPLLLAPRHGV